MQQEENQYTILAQCQLTRQVQGILLNEAILNENTPQVISAFSPPIHTAKYRRPSDGVLTKP